MVKLSIIIVNYHVGKELFKCIFSIYASKPKTVFEIIVIDNDERKTIEKELKKQFPKVRYVKNDNKGFGQGNNVGSRYAKGEYLFFLNPDTLVSKNTIDVLISYLDKHKKVGIAAPLLYDMEGDVVSLQGARELTPLRAIFSFSFINKFFPNNQIAKKYWYKEEWNKKSVKDVESIPGTAFVIRRELYETIKGFDENFFLYFEENDLSKRVTELGWKIIMHPEAKVSHILGSSTSQSKKDVSKIFQQSRFYYLKKHFGFLRAVGAECVLRFNKYWLFLTFFLAVGAYLRFTYLDTAMAFIGDQGWYYLSARDMMLTGHIPLIGIPSSHPWISQGAYWTYLLGPVLWLFQFHPLSGAYLSGTIGLLGIIALYKLGSSMFSRGVGIIAAGFFATSPFVVFSDRMPYHTSPIPLVTIFALFALYKWVRGNIYYFPILIMFLAVLYNFELATFLLSILVGIIWVYGYLVKKDWAKKVVSIKYLILSVTAFVIPMLPMILHDIQNGFPQTLKFLAWVGYRILVLFGYPPINPITPVSFQEMISFITRSYELLVFSLSGFAASLLFVSGCFLLISHIIKQKDKSAFILLGCVNLFLLVGLFVVKTPSGAYFPLLFPGLILMVALVFNELLQNKRYFVKGVGVVSLLLILALNGWFIVQHIGNDTNFIQRLNAARHIVKEAGEKEYNLRGQGAGSEHASFTMSYEYLVWWLGHGPAQTEQGLKFVIREENGEIKVEKEVSSIK